MSPEADWEKAKANQAVVEKYVEACALASSRARFVLIVIITASVLAFGAFWNSREGSWIDSRLRVARAAVKWWEFKPEVRQALEPDQKELFDLAQKFVAVRKIESQEDVKNLLEQLQDLETGSVITIRVPFFGVLFDVNDLGLVAGFGFVVLLMWFRFSVARELSNLMLAFEEAKSREHLQFGYDLLAMRQVLTVPPMRNQPRSKFWGIIPYVLYILPVVVQVTILLNDIRSRPYGESLSPSNTDLLFWTSGVFLALSIILTVLCFWTSVKIDEKWAATAKELKIM